MAIVTKLAFVRSTRGHERALLPETHAVTEGRVRTHAECTSHVRSRARRTSIRMVDSANKSTDSILCISLELILASSCILHEHRRMTLKFCVKHPGSAESQMEIDHDGSDSPAERNGREGLHREFSKAFHAFGDCH